MSDVEPQASGMASGLVNTAFMMGGALGLAVLASAVTARTNDLVASAAAGSTRSSAASTWPSSSPRRSRSSRRRSARRCCARDSRRSGTTPGPVGGVAVAEAQ
jgi:hypothetical protein